MVLKLPLKGQFGLFLISGTTFVSPLVLGLDN